MAVYEPAEVLYSTADGGWSVCRADGRLVFINGGSTLEVPVDGPLRWRLDSTDMSFSRALDSVPSELHGWMTLAAVIALRQCLSGIMSAVALPAGYHEWSGLLTRADPVCDWINTLGNLDGVDVPPLPEGLDDGLGDEFHDGGDTAELVRR
jgi:hypothetical protein